MVIHENKFWEEKEMIRVKACPINLSMDFPTNITPTFHQHPII